MKAKMTIRTFRPEDLPDTAKIDAELFGKDRYPALFFRQAFDVFGDLLRVVESGNGEITGYTLGAVQAEPEAGWILALAVKKEYQGQGIATQLTIDLIEILRKRGVKNVKLTVDPANLSAIGLYRKLGFYPVDEYPDYFGPGEPRILMQKELM